MVEDINEVMEVLNRDPTPQRMANYFEILAQLFWKSHNYVYHAYALLRFYTISKNQNRSLQEEDLRRMASRVLVASISVPMENSLNEQARNYQEFFELESEKQKNSRLAASLNLSNIPESCCLTFPVSNV